MAVNGDTSKTKANKTKAAKAPDAASPKQVHDQASSFAAELPIYVNMPPLVTNSQQSGNLGESSRHLAEKVTSRDALTFNASRAVHLPLLSRFLENIRRKTNFITPMLQRVLDLPWFRRRQRRRQGYTQAGNVQDSQFNNIIPKSAQLYPDVLLQDLSDITEAEPSVSAWEETYPAVIRNLSSPLAVSERLSGPVYSSSDDNRGTFMPPITKHTLYNPEPEETGNPLSSGVRSRIPISGLSQPNETREVEHEPHKVAEDRLTIVGGQTRHTSPDQQSSQPFTPITQRKSPKFSPVAARIGIDNESYDFPEPHPDYSPSTNVAGKSRVAASRQPTLPFIENMSKSESSDEAAVDPESPLPAMKSSDRPGILKRKSSEEALSSQSPPVINRETIMIPGETTKPEMVNNPDKLPLTYLPAQMVKSSDEAAVDPESPLPAMKSSDRPEILKRKSSEEALSSQSPPVINRETTMIPGKTTKPEIVNKPDKLPLTYLPPQMVKSSDEAAANPEPTPPIVTGSDQPGILKRKSSEEALSSQSPPVINRETTMIPGETTKPEIVNNPDKLPLTYLPPQRVQSSEEAILDSTPASSAIKSLDKTDTLKRRSSSDASSGQSEPVSKLLINRETSRIPGHPAIPDIVNKLNKLPLASLPIQNMAYRQGSALFPSMVVPWPAYDTNQVQAEKPVAGPSKNRGQDVADSALLPEGMDNPDISPDLPSTFALEPANIDQSMPKGNIRDSRFDRVMRSVIGSTLQASPIIEKHSQEIASNSQRILKSPAHSPLHDNSENYGLPQNIEYVPFSSDYRYASQLPLNLPVVTSAQRKMNSSDIHSEDLFRHMSDTTPGTGYPMNRTVPELTLAPVKVSRVTEPKVSLQHVAPEPPAETSGENEATPDLRSLAEKVYAILRQELKIERERERHRLLR